MKVVFAGPSLCGATPDLGGIDLRPPAAQGDIYSAVAEGADVIGLIDGYFGSTASVWHKEILHALSEGVLVIGGASMGALRAVECAPFGMRPVGRIAQSYLHGEFDDDGLVAICHAPADLGFAPITEALVDLRATLDHLQVLGAVSEDEAVLLLGRAERLFFADRTLSAVLEAVDPLRRAMIEAGYRGHFVGMKQADALLVLDEVRRASPSQELSFPWKMRVTPTWLDFIAGRENA